MTQQKPPIKFQGRRLLNEVASPDVDVTAISSDAEEPIRGLGRQISQEVAAGAARFLFGGASPPKFTIAPESNMGPAEPPCIPKPSCK
ncbi:hypothetical protein ACLOJK_040390 [Asimina triloba]